MNYTFACYVSDYRQHNYQIMHRPWHTTQGTASLSKRTTNRVTCERVRIIFILYLGHDTIRSVYQVGSFPGKGKSIK